jgi:hypothetical protein
LNRFGSGTAGLSCLKNHVDMLRRQPAEPGQGPAHASGRGGVIWQIVFVKVKDALALSPSISEILSLREGIFYAFRRSLLDAISCCVRGT